LLGAPWWPLFGAVPLWDLPAPPGSERSARSREHAARQVDAIQRLISPLHGL